MAVEQLLWFSDLARTPVHDESQEGGRVDDLVLRLEEATFATVTGLLVYVNDQAIFVSIDKVANLRDSEIVTTQPISSFTAFERRTGEILVHRDLLNHHLIWTRNRHRPRLVTARDIGIIKDGEWVAAGVDVSSHRRSHLFRTAKTEEDRLVVDWRELLPFVGHVPTARRRLELRNIRKLHPAQLADLLEEASSDEGREIMEALQSDPEFEADVVEEIDPARRRDALRNKTDLELGELLGTMEPDNAVDLLLALDQERRENVLALIPEPEQTSVKKLLLYSPDTAGGMMTTDCFSVSLSASAGQAQDFFRSQTDLPANIWTVFVVDSDRRLVGAIPPVQLFTASREKAVSDLISGEPPSVAPDAEVTDIAITMADYNLATLPVVDGADHILGVITVDDVLPRLVQNGWRRRREAAEID